MQIYNVAHLFHVPRSTFNCNDRRKIVHPYNETNITPFGWAEKSTGYTQSTIVWYAEYGIEHMRQLTRCNLIPNSHLFYLLFFILFSFPNIKENELNWFVLFRDVVLQLVRAVHQTAKEIQLEKKKPLILQLGCSFTSISMANHFINGIVGDLMSLFDGMHTGLFASVCACEKLQFPFTIALSVRSRKI